MPSTNSQKAAAGLIFSLLAACSVLGQAPQTAATRPILGHEETAYLRYDSSAPFTNAQNKVEAVTNVAIAGT